MIDRRRLLASLAVAALPTHARAQSYPTRPVRLIVPFAPGGSVDTFGRLLSDRLSRSLEQQFYVENIAGATGNIGTGRAAKADPDGQTVLLAFSSHVINPALFASLPYDPIKDFEPVTLAVSATHAIIVHPSVPATSLADLIALVKANPGKYSFAHGGVGTPGHLLGEQLRLTAAIDLAPVPFNGAGPAVTSVLTGHTQIGVTALSPAAPQIADGKIRALAVTSARRSRLMPDVQTTAEAGQPAIVGDLWVGVLLPARTPKAIAELLQREIATHLAAPDLQEKLAAVGFEPVGSTSDEFARRMAAEAVHWRSVIEAAKIKPL
ncbi:Bug family tripartite tricarboxylate transporter substrate binding protein [Bosea thiooxidans]